MMLTIIAIMLVSMTCFSASTEANSFEVVWQIEQDDDDMEFIVDENKCNMNGQRIDFPGDPATRIQYIAFKFQNITKYENYFITSARLRLTAGGDFDSPLTLLIYINRIYIDGSLCSAFDESREWSLQPIRWEVSPVFKDTSFSSPDLTTLIESNYGTRYWRRTEAIEIIITPDLSARNDYKLMTYSHESNESPASLLITFEKPNWPAWSNWTECSTTNSNDTQSRYRECSSTGCPGNSTEQKDCFLVPHQAPLTRKCSTHIGLKGLFVIESTLEISTVQSAYKCCGLCNLNTECLSYAVKYISNIETFECHLYSITSMIAGRLHLVKVDKYYTLYNVI